MAFKLPNKAVPFQPAINMNKYLARAKNLQPTSGLAKAMKVGGQVGSAVGGYFDRVLGSGAAKAKARANMAATLKDAVPNAANKRRATLLTDKAKSLAAASSKTRLKTVGAIAGLGVAKKVSNEYSAPADPTYYNQY